jgi:hypothetical protein
MGGTFPVPSHHVLPCRPMRCRPIPSRAGYGRFISGFKSSNKGQQQHPFEFDSHCPQHSLFFDSQFHILFLIEIENHQRREQQR